MSPPRHTDFAEANRILDEKFGQDRSHGLRFPAATFFAFPDRVLDWAEAVFQDYAPQTGTDGTKYYTPVNCQRPKTS